MEIALFGKCLVSKLLRIQLALFAHRFLQNLGVFLHFLGDLLFLSSYSSTLCLQLVNFFMGESLSFLGLVAQNQVIFGCLLQQSLSFLNLFFKYILFFFQFDLIVEQFSLFVGKFIQKTLVKRIIRSRELRLRYSLTIALVSFSPEHVLPRAVVVLRFASLG